MIQQTEQAAYFNFMEPEEESRMHAEPEYETIPYWDSWYSSHFPLPQWSLNPDIDTGGQLKVRTFRMLLITSYENDLKMYRLQQWPI